ncbi:MAG: glycosyltransferase family 9 protein [Marinilabiliaceae bacterium]
MAKKILVFRFSALGDVAMTVPVLWSFVQQYPGHEVWFVSRPFASDLVGPIPNVRFFPVDVKGVHKGLPGLLRLFRELRKNGPWEAVIDLHSVLRTHVLTSLFKIFRVRTNKIDKGRKEKRALTRKKNKIFRPLPSTVSRYQDTFGKAGFTFKMLPFPGKTLYGKSSKEKDADEASVTPGAELTGFTIGVAPFAKHKWKMWPEEKMWTLLQELDKLGYEIILFGGPGEEQGKLEDWASKLKKANTFAGRLKMKDELRLMSQLDVMISMDSANMHLASLVETRVVSIWGATHPYAGFYGYEQSQGDAVQIDLECRPCSVFGDKTCHRGDFACMMSITPQMVLKKVFKQ